MWQSRLADRFQKAANSNAGAAKIRVGERPHLSTVAILVWDPQFKNNSDTFESVHAEDVEDASERACGILEDSGFGTEYPNARVDFLHAETGKGLPSWAATEKTSEQVQAGPSVEAVLVDALRQNNAEIRRMFAMVCETLGEREARIDADRDELIESRIEAVESRAEAELTQILAEEYADAVVEEDPLKAQAGAILQQVAQQFFQPTNSPRETLLSILRQDHALTAELAGDPEVVALFQQAVMSQAEENNGMAEEVVEDPAPPSPMPE